MSLHEMIELGDPDELLREIDRRCDRRDWDGLLELRDRCRLAVERGKQLWGVAGYAEYRAALEAPPRQAAMVLEADPGPFALGPLPEVMANKHSWSDLSPHLPASPLAGLVAYERVALGEDLSESEAAETHRATFELPLKLEEWEPAYPQVTYRADEIKAPKPLVTPMETLQVNGTDWSEVVDRRATSALSDLTAGWVAGSNGVTTVASVEGDLSQALSAIGAADRAAIRISPQDALSLMAWAGASGGAHGRRAGLASGRSKAWWALAGVTGLSEQWLPDSDALGRRAEELLWYTWPVDQSVDGWDLRLAIVDLIDDVAFAVDSVDRVEA